MAAGALQHGGRGERRTVTRGIGGKVGMARIAELDAAHAPAVRP